jgi:hypothetical protein
MADAPREEATAADAAARLDLPPERLALARQHAALLGKTAEKVAVGLPLTTDVDDFRRVLTREARP